MNNIAMFVLMLSLIGCFSDERDIAEIDSPLEFEQSEVFPISEKIANVQGNIHDLDKDWGDPEEVAHNRKMQEQLEQYLNFLHALEQSPFVYHDKKIKILIPGETLTDAQLEEYDLALEALSAVLEGSTLPDGIRLLVENSDDEAVVTFAANTPQGAAGPSYLAKVFMDSDTGEIINVIGGI